jgi:hypothetical protein
LFHFEVCLSKNSCKPCYPSISILFRIPR